MSQRTKCLAPIQGRNQIQKYESVFHKMFSKEQVTKENLSKQKASKATRIEHLAHIQSSIISNAKICVGCERERERWQDKPWCNRTDYKEACLHTKRLEKLLQVSKPTDYNC